jgi:hypothetical protein
MADPDIASQIMEVLADPMNLPDTFWGYMVQRWLADAPVFPISQVFGFAQTFTLRGTINSDGTIKSGTGFTVVKNSTGNYTVTFSTAFAVQPVVLVTALSLNLINSIGSVTTSGFTSNFIARDGTLFDTAFNFATIATA